MVESWKRTGGRERVIRQAEILLAFLAVQAWGVQIEGRRVILFVDNDAAKQSLVGGTSVNLASAYLVDTYWTRVVECALSMWVERVASKANPADAPSRFELVELRAAW